MAIIKKYNKKNDTTYVYESVSYWDKEKQQPRSKRKLIGKVDPVTGETIPTGGRGRKPQKEASITIPTIDSGVGDDNSEVDSPTTELKDYRQLYEETRKLLLEKETTVFRLDAAVSQLIKEKQELVAKLEQLLREYKH